jgi:hypothetical protein
MLHLSQEKEKRGLGVYENFLVFSDVVEDQQRKFVQKLG